MTKIRCVNYLEHQQDEEAALQQMTIQKRQVPQKILVNSSKNIIIIVDNSFKYDIFNKQQEARKLMEEMQLEDARKIMEEDVSLDENEDHEKEILKIPSEPRRLRTATAASK